jgi:hypothetical protein
LVNWNSMPFDSVKNVGVVLSGKGGEGRHGVRGGEGEVVLSEV